MDGEGIVFFDTRIGRCGLAWTPKGFDGVALPDRDAKTTQIRFSRRFAARPQLVEPPSEVLGVAQRVQGLLNGKPDALTDVPLDLRGVSDFARTVYRTLRRVRPGSTITYGRLAQRVGRPAGARAVGRTMAANPLPILVPCHRVVRSDNALGGFSAAAGVRLKAKMLYFEGVVLDPEVEKGLAMLRKADPVMAAVIDRIGPYLAMMGRTQSPYEALVQSILYQQLSMKAAATIAGRFAALGQGRYPRPDRVMRMRPATLRNVGISAQKASYLRDLADKVRTKKVDLNRVGRLDDEGVIEALCQIKGIGRWSAQMFLIFHLGRLDVLPVGDLGFQKGVQHAYGLKSKPDPARLDRMGERWKPFRSLATWYLWQNLGAGGQY